MAIYGSESPAQSSSSLSDVDDDGDRIDFTAENLQPARWSSSGHSRAANSSPRRRSRLPLAAQSPVSRLPPELLIHVFKQLGLRDQHKCLRVSRQWCACGIQLIWHRPHIRDEHALKLFLRTLADHEPSFTYPDFIRRLNFAMLHRGVTNLDIARLAVCSKLERLTLMNCKAVSDDSLIRLFAHTQDLVALDLSGLPEVSDYTLIAVGKNATRLQGLNLTNCKLLTDTGIIALSSGCRLLRRLKLACVENVTDNALFALASHCQKLLEIDLTRCPHITDAGVRELWSRLIDLRELKVSYCSSLTDAAHPAAPHIVANPFGVVDASSSPLRLNHTFEHFRILELSGCPLVTDDAIAGIIAHAPKIRSLSLAKCSQLTDTALESICALGRHLHDLHLGHVNRITDRAVCQLARSCTRLRYVDLACCNNLTDMAVIELSQLQKLRRIGLVRVTKLTDQAVFALGERQAATLERIHLSYCDNISIPAIHYLLQRLPKLMHLSLTGIPSFRTADLQQFCRTPPEEFTDNQRAAFCVFSGDGVKELRKHLQSLMSQLSEGMGRTDTEDDGDDDYDDDFPSMISHAAPQLLDSYEAQMAFLNSPNTVLPPRHMNGNGNGGPALHATLQNLRNHNSFASSSSMTTPDGVTPRGANGRSSSSLQLNNLSSTAVHGWSAGSQGGAAYVAPAELAETLRGYAQLQQQQQSTSRGGGGTRSRQLPLREDSSSSSHGHGHGNSNNHHTHQQHRHRNSRQHNVPFPAESSGSGSGSGLAVGLGLHLDPAPTQQPQPGPSSQRDDESRGRRVRRSLRNTLNAASSLFGRAGSSSSGARTAGSGANGH
ncbi:RNI-like protein [Exidia glandulosa HHB12029]|uniref:RNI-like protein n=1 Tax=Exidia glandulosa HHB12029 TaxID=1314781 RepID=A0A165CZW1_EXIGL|nr:RNI-like protein [Exidia glandulosa HHB12029]